MSTIIILCVCRITVIFVNVLYAVQYILNYYRLFYAYRMSKATSLPYRVLTPTVVI